MFNFEWGYRLYISKGGIYVMVKCVFMYTYLLYMYLCIYFTNRSGTIFVFDRGIN